jgi:hypothetical protein
MASPLAGSLARQISRGLARTFLPATLTRITTADPEPETPWIPGEASAVTYPCRAIHDAWGETWLSGGLVGANEVRITILAHSLAIEPAPGDVVTIRGEAYTIVPAGSGKPAVATDPAKATWECRAVSGGVIPD